MAKKSKKTESEAYSTPADELEELINRLKAEKLQMEIRKIKNDEEYMRAGENATRTINFYAGVSSASVYTTVEQLDRYMLVDPGCEILIKINSPGGSVFDGFGLVDKIFEAETEGHHITTRAYGMCASMGMALLASGNTRQVTENAHLMVHEISSGMIGKYSDMQDEVELMDRLQDRYFRVVSDRSVYSPKQLKKLVARKDIWMDADEALKDGFVDEIYGR